MKIVQNIKHGIKYLVAAKKVIMGCSSPKVSNNVENWRLENAKNICQQHNKASKVQAKVLKIVFLFISSFCIAPLKRARV